MTFEQEVGKLIAAIEGQGVYEANVKCDNDVCRRLGRLKRKLETHALSNGMPK